METSAKLYSLNYSNVRTYLFALLLWQATLHFHKSVICTIRWSYFIADLFFHVDRSL